MVKQDNSVSEPPICIRNIKHRSDSIEGTDYIAN